MKGIILRNINNIVKDICYGSIIVCIFFSLPILVIKAITGLNNPYLSYGIYVILVGLYFGVGSVVDMSKYYAKGKEINGLHLIYAFIINMFSTIVVIGFLVSVPDTILGLFTNDPYIKFYCIEVVLVLIVSITTYCTCHIEMSETNKNI